MAFTTITINLKNVREGSDSTGLNYFSYILQIMCIWEIQIHTNFGKAEGFSNTRQFVFTNCRSTTNTTKEIQNPNTYQTLGLGVWDFL